MLTHTRTQPRRTLRSAAVIRGVGLFTGTHTVATIHPAQACCSGIHFRRVDAGASRILIPADAAGVIPESRRTVLSADPADKSAPTVQTVEHILSALAGLGVTDAIIDIDGPEVPIADGSARPFVDEILDAEIVDLPGTHSPRTGAMVRSPIVIEDAANGWRIEALPSDQPGLHLTYHLKYPPGAPIPPQHAAFHLAAAPADSAPDYAQHVAPARTFCLLQEAQAMRAMGLFAHVTPREMIVIGPDGPIDNPLRFPDEPARHKLLDLLGDLSLCGRVIQGRVVATRTGHAQNHAMAKALAAIPSA